ncbi:FSR family fosmidomycin resistance protein-like MFS transporter [Microvirga flocculans]|uniref:FSR family fosmidomycin resistance protein-like MFS transporter n=1 Tax=Microvirga flocculans TaxID=217168 RepID=A0A7W6ID14_9HYPH|nr:MFS transporter [Microvirga flocculans]MBB4039217.1 FSR family fosmidomycin resistance protein-like MFS transporter [Microvirga flocculans]
MDTKSPALTAPPLATTAERTAVPILLAISVSHMLNDLIQSLLPAIYPILKETFRLDFGQIGLLTLTFQLTASLLQPVVGILTDRKPQPFSLVIGMGFTLVGLLTLSQAHSFPLLLLGAALVGMGSSVFHPESSRVARMASGGQHGLAQSVFQVGGNTGTALGPLLAAFIVVPFGQASIAWFSAVALLAMLILFSVGRWYRAKLADMRARPRAAEHRASLSRRRVAVSITILMLLVFSKNFYMASLTSYFTFYLIAKFQLPVQDAQIYLFIFLGAVAAGTLLGGPVGDRIGRRYVIWISILGVLPFTLLMPYANLFWTAVLSFIIGLILASAFSAILVYATELVPGRVGMIAGLFFGLSFGMGGLGAAALGQLADMTGIETVYKVCAFLPAIGLLAYFLPKIERARA